MYVVLNFVYLGENLWFVKVKTWLPSRDGQEAIGYQDTDLVMVINSLF